VNDVIRKIFASGYVEDAQGNRHRPTVSIPTDTGAILYDLIRAARPSRTLEIGLAYGISSLFICQALADNQHGRHVAIDPQQKTGFNSIGLLNLERARLRDLVDWREAASDVALPELWRAGERFQFAFIDGCHLFDVALLDFYYIDKMLSAAGYVVLDDIWMPGIRKLVSFIVRNRSYELVGTKSSAPVPLWKRVGRIGVRFLRKPVERNSRLKLSPRNVVVLRKTADDNRAWDYHRSF
jgi:predicted O-methyltransferase YrrM